MKSQAKKKRADAAAAPKASSGEFLRAWLLLAVVALCVARPLLPSEAVSWNGDGQPFDMLWIVLAGGYFSWAAWRGGLIRRLDLIDGAVGALVVLCAVSSLAGAANPADEMELELGLIGSGSPRMAVNMLFEWVGLGLLFILVRQLVCSAREARALIAVMVALAVVESAYGFYQVMVSLPASRAEYAAHPDEVLRMMDQWYPPGSPERLRFESRLQSTEPLGTFALTNSLAGFLAPWLVMGLAIGWNLIETNGASRRSPDSRWTAMGTARLAALALCLLGVAGCFVLTKSRTGYVALAAGVLLLPLFSGAGRRMLQWKFALAGAISLAVVIVAGLALGGLDVALLSEASKSLNFRLEYWRSTMAMILRYPWLGVGPGNFQDYYTQFKLPEASEEVRDPHNFVLEVWATAGTFALVALATTLGAFAVRVARAAEWTAEPSEPPAPAASRNVKFIVAGGAAGLGLAFLIAPSVGFEFSEGQLAGGLILGAAVVAILWPWIDAGTIGPRLPALAALVLAIHLLASGGITFPGVAGTFWICLALGLSLSGPAPAIVPVPRAWCASLAPLCGAVLMLAAGAACFVFSYQPVLASRAAMTEAFELRDFKARLKACLRAAQADPISPEPWAAIAQMEFDRWKQNPENGPSLQMFASAAEHINRLRPHSSAAWRQTAKWYLEIYEQNQSAEAAASAVDCFRNAVELYPNSGPLRGEYALALALTGQAEPARRQARKALELDALTPHADKKIPADVRDRLEVLAAE